MTFRHAKFFNELVRDANKDGAKYGQSGQYWLPSRTAGKRKDQYYTRQTNKRHICHGSPPPYAHICDFSCTPLAPPVIGTYIALARFRYFHHCRHRCASFFAKRLLRMGKGQAPALLLHILQSPPVSGPVSSHYPPRPGSYKLYRQEHYQCPQNDQGGHAPSFQLSISLQSQLLNSSSNLRHVTSLPTFVWRGYPANKDANYSQYPAPY